LILSEFFETKFFVMKSTLMFATLSIALAYPSAFAKSELETLRSRCVDQEKQIHHLEGENHRLKGTPREKHAAVAKAVTVSKAPSKSKASSSGYTVVAGDSLEKIARKLGTNPQKLGALNGIKASTIIHPGQKLKAPGASTAMAKVRSTAPKNVASKHKMRREEGLANVSSKRKNRSETVAMTEPKKQPASIHADQETVLDTQLIAATKAPTHEERMTAPVVPTPPVSLPTPLASTKEDIKPAAGVEPVASKSEKKIRAITIDGEMTYGEFAAKHGTDAERLNALNGLDLTTATVLAKGSELYVPAEP
jgi:LysM repeat protein